MNDLSSLLERIKQAGGGDAYDLLKRAGHTPAKAAEIVLDAERGDPLALIWIDSLLTALIAEGVG